LQTGDGGVGSRWSVGERCHLVLWCRRQSRRRMGAICSAFEVYQDSEMDEEDTFAGKPSKKAQVAPGPPTEVLCASLNCLGDAYNPFEFLCDDASFDAAYKRLHATAEALTWPDVVAACGEAVMGLPQFADAYERARLHCSGDAGATLWTYFNESVLSKDNKLVASRFNLLTLAMRPHKEGLPCWKLFGSWHEEMLGLADGTSYSKDANLWLWDLACNTVATRGYDDFRSICTTSYLNPANFERDAAIMVDAAIKLADGRPLLLACQEFPRIGTARRDAFDKACARPGVRLTITQPEETDSVAFVSSSALGSPSDALPDATRVQELMQSCLDESEGLDKKAVQGALDTTARKVLALSFPAVEATFVTVHCKEPKTAAAAMCVARFIKRIGDAAAIPQATVVPPPLVAMIDGNFAKAALVEAFNEAIGQFGMAAVPDASVPTTTKRRSILHGQCYDTSKCMLTVRGPKDKILAPKEMLSQCEVFPDTSQNGGLPSVSWASDHKLVTAVLNLKS